VPAGQPFRDVLDAAQRREPWALTALFREHHPPLLRFLRALERDAADDLAGEVWVAVAQRVHAFRGDERAFRAWVFRIARNRLADHRRQGIRRRTDPAPPERFEQHAARDDPAGLVAERLAAQEAVDRLITALPADQAEIVLLRVVAGLSADEVAELTGRSAGAVRVIQHRALRRLALRFPPRAVTR
jgi:RNA polymerase sigma-70 factor (ECF subfamily)